MAKTMAEKIFSQKAGSDVSAGDVITAGVDVIMTNDASGPLTIDYFHKMHAAKVMNPENVIAIIDHYVPCPSRKVAGLQQMLFDFASTYGIQVIPGGEGIAHQVLDELNLVQPGRLIVGGDSHTIAQGYLNCAAVGVGASDLAVAIQTGSLWFKVPETIRVEFVGSLHPGITGKDVALHLLRSFENIATNYRAIEFGGDGVASLSIHDRKTICNLMAECSAKCAIMPFDEVAETYCRERNIQFDGVVSSDRGCQYAHTIEVDLAAITYQVSLPHHAAKAVPISLVTGQKINMVLMGTCTNGRLEDFQEVHQVIQQTDRPFAVETLVVPASRTIYLQMVEAGYVALLLKKGAMILPPGCGPCCGSSPGIPGDHAIVLSTANRNFIGRMGNPSAEIYLSSPRVAAATALTGEITNPEELIKP